MGRGVAMRQQDIFDGLNIVHLKALGVWYNMNVYRTKGIRSTLFNAQVIITLLFNVPYIVFQLIYILTEDVNAQKIFFVSIIIFPCLELLCKMFFFFYHLEGICEIYEALRNDFLQNVPVSELPRADEVYRQTARKCNGITVLAYSSMLLTLVTVITNPGYETEPGSGRMKPVTGWYPFPISQSPAYEIVYAYEAIFTFWTGAYYTVYECAVLIPLVCLCGHFDVLRLHISSLRKDLQGAGSESHRNAVLYEELKNAIKDYEMLLSFGDSVKRVYNSMITILLATVTFGLTISVLHMVFEDQGGVFRFKVSAAVSFQLAEVSLICLCSSMMETASSGIHEALYSNDWYLADQKFAKTQHIMMIRARRPLTLVAARMYPVNLETLLSILQFIYSTAAVFSKI